MHALLLLFMLHLSFLGIGRLILFLTQRDKTFSASSCYVLGLLSFLSICYAQITFMPLSKTLVICLLVVGLLCLAPCLKFSGVKSPRALHIAAAMLLIPPGINMLVFLSSIPELSFDGTAIWGAKAKHLVFGAHLASDYFTNPKVIHPHTGYPLGLPLLFASSNLLAPADNAELIWKSSLAFISIALLASIWSELRLRSSSNIATCCIASLLFAPGIHSYRFAGSLVTSYADAPLALLLAVSALAFLRFLDTATRDSLLLCICSLGLLLLLKNEGAVLCGISLLTYTLSLSLERKVNVKLLCLIACTPICVWLLMRSAHSFSPTTSDLSFSSLSYSLAAMKLVPQMLGFALSTLFDVSRFGYAGVLSVALFFLLGTIKHRKLGLLQIIPLIYLLFVCFMMALTEVELHAFERVYRDSTFPRLLLHTFPLMLVLSYELIFVDSRQVKT